MSFWLPMIALLIVLLATAEITYRIGLRSPRADNERLRSQVTTVQASTLGLLALILGFTMSMAEQRFNTRRAMNMEESGAVGRAYLLFDALPESDRSQNRQLLRRYVEVRRAYYAARGNEVARATREAQAINAQLAAIATQFAREHPDWDISASIVDSIAEVIRLEAARELVLAARVPRTVHVLLVLVAAVAVGISGIASGLARARSFLTLFVVPILIAVAFLLIADIDRSRAGLITTGDAPMARLQKVMSAEQLGTSALR